jgi:hypothetical protein
MKFMLFLALGVFVFGSMGLLVYNLNGTPYKQKVQKV